MYMIFFIIFSTSIELTRCMFSSSNDTHKKWRNVFVEEQDTILLSYLRNYENENKVSNNVVKDDYYRTVSTIAQNSCQIIKQFAGRWSNECGFVDGEKSICMDGLYKAIENGTCLVYSFGLADDWDFEILMASLGCTVHAYDPTSKVKMDPQSLKYYDNLHYHRIGIGKEDGKTSIIVDDREEIVPINTLKTMLENNGNDKKYITYLKIDIEGQEIWNFRNWITTNALRYVNQLGIEMHTCCTVIRKSNIKEFRNLMKFMQQILKLYNLKLVGYNPNRCQGKHQDSQLIYYSYHDALFVK